MFVTIRESLGLSVLHRASPYAKIQIRTQPRAAIRLGTALICYSAATGGPALALRTPACVSVPIGRWPSGTEVAISTVPQRR